MTKELSTTGLQIDESSGVAFVEVDTTLLVKAAQLNRLSEVSQVALGMCLVKIKEDELYKPGYDSFPAYYQAELGRVKSDVSKLLTLGRKLLDSGFTEETAPAIGYTKLYTAFSVFPDKPIKYVLAAAESNTISEMLENKREELHPNCKHKNTHACTACDDCGNHTRNQEPF